MSNSVLAVLPMLATALCVACSNQSESISSEAPKPTTEISSDAEVCPDHSADRNLYWGDLHVHTALSLDAYAFGTLATPSDAYRFAKGSAYELPQGPIKLERPLDFIAVTDHAEWLDLMHICTDPQRADDLYCQTLRAQSRQNPPGQAFADYVVPTITRDEPQRTPLCEDDPDRCEVAWLGNWKRIQDAANTQNEPCGFSALIGFEWTATPGFSHTHRNVIFANENVTREAIDYIRYPVVEDLWEQLELQCRPEDGCDAVTIPHNTNMGDGKSFDVETSTTRSLELRTRYERLMEIHQEKGSSECLTPFGAADADGDCTFENYITRRSQPATQGDYEPEDWERMRRSYARGLLLRGLQATADVTPSNPLQLGFIGSTDTHAATPGLVSEENWQGTVFGFGNLDRMLTRSAFNPGGLVGVWAEQNTRADIFSALKRREVYGTSGPRIPLRFSVAIDGQTLSCDAAESTMEPGSITMGGEFSSTTAPPMFKVQALSDNTPLQSVEIIKGEWRDGELRESRIGIWQKSGGAASVCEVWTDPDFLSDAPAFWYTRVLETEKPRWSKLKCEAVDRCEEFPDADQMIQDRAWASPIWFVP